MFIVVPQTMLTFSPHKKHCKHDALLKSCTSRKEVRKEEDHAKKTRG
jgi:hypothetical protein